MDKEKQKELKASYPLTFARLFDESESFYSISKGIDCGNGWYNLLETLAAKIERYLETCPEDQRDGAFGLLQIKEKFGGLRFYCQGVNFPEELKNAINEAESLSYRTCEICGEPGKLRSSSWLMTLCDDHAGGKPVATAFVGEGFYED